MLYPQSYGVSRQNLNFNPYKLFKSSTYSTALFPSCGLFINMFLLTAFFLWMFTVDSIFSIFYTQLIVVFHGKHIKKRSSRYLLLVAVSFDRSLKCLSIELSSTFSKCAVKETKDLSNTFTHHLSRRQAARVMECRRRFLIIDLSLPLLTCPTSFCCRENYRER